MTEKQQENKLVDKLGSPLTLAAHTERSAERDQENSDFISVIIKRNDEGARHPDD
ncbi:MAG: formate/nitrite transporter family protein, partial [Candidatus Electrothrix sp. AR1]|nr:formate/nitrite transporter family protein [Candidatus Electrothrix sp. AR1]